ncbi:hypothetical protein QBC36DRAFT_318019 [Triangularia setosa]|uniref:Uncharacterized protein n=1 Tax=Triangularia setosa TaxID=2587417 RepID=A0AAN6WJR7_9PEZI|nr:hypothetical protein QBC36DRAFT_318019 [Podospora setosa]
MVDLTPCNPRAQSHLTDAAGNEGGDVDLHHPHHPPTEGNIIEEQTTTSDTPDIPTPPSTVNSVENTGPPTAVNAGDDDKDDFTRFDGQPRGFSMMGAALRHTAAEEYFRDALLVDDAVSSLELCSPAESSSARAGSMFSRLSVSDDEHDGNRGDDHSERLLAFLENDREGVASRLLDPTYVSTITEGPNRIATLATRMAYIVAGGAAVQGTVPSPYQYRCQIEETQEELL